MKTRLFQSVALNLSISSLICGLCCSSPARAFDMVGMFSYNIGLLNPKPSSFVSKSNTVGYAFFGRLDAGPGQIETGFHYTPVSITTLKSFGEVKASGGYWIFPVLYRFHFLPPFFSLAAGFDYALEGSTKLDVAGAGVNGSGGSSGYRSHFGYEVSLAAHQDVGENLSLVLDARYRGSIGSAIAFDDTNVKYDLFSVLVGLQKHLD